jgi:Domain of unknown function (DUF1911)/Domain of unknown function (DUF1910)
VNRDGLKSREWFDEWIAYEVDSIKKFLSAASLPSGNTNYQPQFVYEISTKNLWLLLRRYSRGDAVHELSQYFAPLMSAWEEADRLGKDVWTEQQKYTRNAWKANLDFYITSFWLVGLALALEIPDDQWQRLVALIGNEGEDKLLDMLIASRQPDRKVGMTLCHPKPYRRLLDAVLAKPDDQPRLLLEFVKHWYMELDRPATKELPAVYARPYWYNYHELEGGYFGYWCVEAVAAVKALGIDDSLCIGHPNYPGDLLRREGSETHPLTSSEQAQTAGVSHPSSPKGKSFSARLFGRRE